MMAHPHREGWTRVLILDQWNIHWISPYSLQVKPIQFDDLIRDTEGAELALVPDDFSPRWGTTLIRADPTTGVAEVWKSKIDSTG